VTVDSSYDFENTSRRWLQRIAKKIKINASQKNVDLIIQIKKYFEDGGDPIVVDDRTKRYIPKRVIKGLETTVMYDNDDEEEELDPFDFPANLEDVAKLVASFQDDNGNWLNQNTTFKVINENDPWPELEEGDEWMSDSEDFD